MYAGGAVAFSPDDSLFAGGYSGGVVDVFRVSDGQMLHQLYLPGGGNISSLAFSPDGQVLAVGSNAPARLYLWQVEEGVMLAYYDRETGKPSGGGVTALAYSSDGKFIYYGRSDGVMAQMLNPCRSLVIPTHGGNTGSVSVKIVTPSTFELTGVVQVRLTAPGTPDIVANDVTVLSPHLATGRFDLQGATLGKRDVIISVTGSSSLTCPQGFTVEKGVQPRLTTEILGPQILRPGAPCTYYVLVNNSGNVDANRVNLRVEFSNTLDWYPLPGQEAADRFVGEHNTSIGLPIIPVAGSVVVPIRLGFPPSTGGHVPFRTMAWINPDPAMLTYIGDGREPLMARFAGAAGESVEFIGYQDFTGAVTRLASIRTRSAAGDVCTMSFGSDGNLASIAGPYGASLSFTWTAPGTAVITPTSPGGQIGDPVTVHFPDGTIQAPDLPSGSSYLNSVAVDGVVKSTSSDEKCAKWSSANKAEVQFYCATLTVLGGVLLFIPGAGQVIGPMVTLGGAMCAFFTVYVFPGWGGMGGSGTGSGSSSCGESRTSGDPNDITGPDGFGPNRWVGAKQPMTYVIQFENKPEATAPAADIYVTGHLDPINLDLTTVNLGEISFGDKIASPTLDSSPPVGTRQFNAEVDLRPANNLIVKINANLDMLTGKLKWTLNSIDPYTGLPPDDPMAGFLPPGGQGSMMFSVMPKDGLATGTLVKAKASIVFDYNAPMDTPEWFNTIDVGSPWSRVLPLPETTGATSFTVIWGGLDDESGMRDYNVYVSDNSGPFQPWLSMTTDTQSTFTGENGHTYAFYSQATDNAYNQEIKESQIEAVTTIVATNTPPDAVDDSVDVNADSSVDVPVLANDTDPDGDPLTVTEVTQGAHGAVSINPDGTVRYTPAQGFSGTDMFTYTISDGNSGSDDAIVTVTVVDTTAPTIVAPADVTAEATSKDGTPVTLGTPTVSDNSDPNPTVTNNAPALFPLGTTVVTWTATDASGNTATAKQNVTVADTTSPSITAPPDIQAEATGPSGTQVNLGNPVVSDALDPNPVVTNDAPALFQLGTTVVTWTAKDASGNTATAKQNVTVVDATPPSIAGPPDITAEATGTTGTAVNLGTPTVSDTVDPNPVVTNDAPALFMLGVTVVTWTATDASGNAASATQKVTVVDTTPPTILSLLANPSVLWPANHKMVAVVLTVKAADICDAAPVCKIVSVTSNEPINGLGDGDTAPDWQITGDMTLLLRAERSGKGPGRVYTITIACRDASGNVSTANVQVTVPHDKR
jgi:hypothetical protein